VRSSGILPCECAIALRGSLDARPCAFSELARIVRATLRAVSPCARRALRGPFFGGILPQKPEHNSHELLIEAVQGCTASWIPAPFAVPSIAGDGGKYP